MKKNKDPKARLLATQENIIRILLRRPALITAILILLSFLIGTLILIVTNNNPKYLYLSILQGTIGINLSSSTASFFNIRYIGEWLVYSMPLLLTGMSMSFAMSTSLWNIGAEGQYTIGLTTVTLGAFILPAIPGLHVISLVLLAILMGGLWAAIAGWLKAELEVSEVVSTIMLNYIAYYLSRILIRLIPGTNTFKTLDYPETALLFNDFLRDITRKSSLNNGIFIVVLILILYEIILHRTSFGLSLKATGLNKYASKLSGINTKLNIIVTMFISGSFAGLAGAIVGLGTYTNGRLLAGLDGYGFSGITVSLVGGLKTLGLAFSGLLFGGLAASQHIMQLNGIPKNIVEIITGSIVILIAFATGIQIYLEKKSMRIAQKLKEPKPK